MPSITTILNVLFLLSLQTLARLTEGQDPNAMPLLRRDTVLCYNSGHATSRGTFTTAIDSFCDEAYAAGKLTSNEYFEKSYPFGAGHRIVVTVEPRGCGAVDPDLMWKVTLRRPVDECDTSSTEEKQGRTVDTACATWRIDPQAE